MLKPFSIKARWMSCRFRHCFLMPVCRRFAFSESQYSISAQTSSVSLLRTALRGGYLGLLAQAYVSTLVRVRRYLSLILTDVAGHGLTVKTNPAGNLPQTQTINAMVMKNLFFFVHVDHFYSLYVKQHSFELLL